MADPAPDPQDVLLVLHAHLPWVRHPEHASFLEERWLFEALWESYVPITALIERRHARRAPSALTLSFSASLLGMLRDPLLRRRFEHHVSALRRLVDAESVRCAAHTTTSAALEDFAAHLEAVTAAWERWDGDLVGRLAVLGAEGAVELWACGGTHAFLPALAHHPWMIEAQVSLAVRTHRRHFGSTPAGFWFPECAYHPVAATALARLGVRTTVLPAHAVARAEPRPASGGMAPIVTPTGLVCFPRDGGTSERVWSSTAGYPGGEWYREFHRDAGWDAPAEALAAFLGPGGIRTPVGLKLHRVGRNAPLGEKPMYEPAQAALAARLDAEDFVARLAADADPRACVTAPYDCELFGHWWFEGPRFLEHVLAAMDRSPRLRATTPARHLADWRTLSVAEPAGPATSWGEGGHGRTWLDDRTAWMANTVLTSLDAFESSVRADPSALRPSEATVRWFAELQMLAASDWPFLVAQGTATHYATQRFRTHAARSAAFAAGAAPPETVLPLHHEDLRATLAEALPQILAGG